MERVQLLKKNPKPREVRIKEFNQGRKNQRNQLLDERRKIHQSPQSKPKAIKAPKKSRLELLKEWKLQKQAKEITVKNVKKPPFYAGKVQRKATGSPILPLSTIQQNRVTTRAQAKKENLSKKPTILNRLNKAENSILQPVENHRFAFPRGPALHKLTIPMSPKITKSARKSTQNLFTDIGGDYPKPKRIILDESVKDNESFKKCKEEIPSILIEKTVDNANNVIFVPHTNCVEMEGDLKQSEKEMKYSPNTCEDLPSKFDHLVFSPLIEKKRGSIRKSFTATKKFYSIDEEIEREEAEKKSRIQGFRLFLKNETSRLMDLSDEWRKLAEGSDNLPNEIIGDINSVVGKTKLLTTDKFKQFEGLIDKCETGDPLIKIDDLQGFHDWVSLEIEDLDKVFFALKDGQARNWASIQKQIVHHDKKMKKTQKPINKVKGASSNIRAHILAARKQMMKKNCTAESEAGAAGIGMSPKSELSSPRPSPITSLSTPKERNLRVQTLRRCSGLEMLAATTKARLSNSPVLNQLTTPRLEVNRNFPLLTTPVRGILRLTPAPKSERKVAFGLDPIFFQPAQDSPMKDSPEVLNLIANTTPLRRSQRLKLKSPGKIF